MQQLVVAGEDGGVRHASTVVRVVEIETPLQEGFGRRLPGHVGSKTDAVDVFQCGRITTGPVDEGRQKS